MNRIEYGDCREIMRRWADEGVKVQTCVTSPPYFGLRDYGVDGQIGLEQTPEQYIAAMVEVFRCVRDVLADDGTLWLNLGSSYASDDKSPNQSPLRQRVPSCGTHDKEPPSSQDAGHVCHGSCDEPQGEIQSRHVSSVRSGQSAEQGEQQTEQTSQGIEHSDSGQSSQQTFPPCDHPSTTGEVFPRDLDAADLSSAALACQKEPPTSQSDAQVSARNSACICGTSRMSQPLAVRTKGKESFFSACNRSDCNGIGRCGYCFGSLTTASLRVKQKDEMNTPHLVAMALQADGWVLRQTICWHKPNPMPESVRDRCTKSHEYLFLLSKSPRYFFDQDAIIEPLAESSVARLSQSNLANQRGSDRVPGKTNGNMKAVARSGNKERKPGSARGCPEGTNSNVCGSVPWEGSSRNKRSVWTVSTRPYKGAHFATFPPALIEPCILAGSRPGDIVLDPFMGSGTTAQVALQHGRQYLGCELNPAYGELIEQRLASVSTAASKKKPSKRVVRERQMDMFLQGAA